MKSFNIFYNWKKKKTGCLFQFQIEAKVILKLSLGEYGRQRTSKKFHDLLRYKGRLRIKSK